MATLEKPNKYPHTHLMLVTTLPMLPVTKPDVFTHFSDYSGLPKDRAKTLLTHGEDPDVEIRLPPYAGLYGWTPENGNDIWLHPALVKAVENLMKDEPEPSTAGVYNYYREQSFRTRVVIPKVRLLLEAVLLHELVHFGRKLLNGYNPNWRAEERIAQEFETKAYGQVQTASSLRIREWVPDPE